MRVAPTTDNSAEPARIAIAQSILRCDAPAVSSESARSLTTKADVENRSAIATWPMNKRRSGRIMPSENKLPENIVFTLVRLYKDYSPKAKHYYS
jgi:hypothetical protein